MSVYVCVFCVCVCVVDGARRVVSHVAPLDSVCVCVCVALVFWDAVWLPVVVSSWRWWFLVVGLDCGAPPAICFGEIALAAPPGE